MAKTKKAASKLDESSERKKKPTEAIAEETETDDGANKKISKSRTSIKCLIILSFSILLPAIIIGAFIHNVSNLQRLDPIKYNDVLPAVPAYKWFYMENFLTKESTSLFRDLALNGEHLSTIVDDKNVESAGEAVEVGHVDCRHPFMTLNLNRTMCHFSNRLDVGMHFVKTGGFNGHIEYYERMVARIIPFRKRLVQIRPTTVNSYDSFINLKRLGEFNSESFVNKVKTICADNTILQVRSNRDKQAIANEMFQLDVLLMLPGQELPMHLNVPYFWGADRNDLPQWLLVIMKKSRLFDHLFIPQVQGITWLSLDDDNFVDKSGGQTGYVDKDGDGGDFYFYPYLPVKIDQKPTEDESDHSRDQYSEENVNKYVILRSVRNSAILLDGAQIIHGVDRYKSYDLPPLFASNHHYNIRFDKQSNYWQLYDYQNNLLRRYYKNDVKLMLAWNMHCFANESDKAKFHSQYDDAAHTSIKKLTLNDIMEVFKKDLKGRDRLPSDNIEPLELWTIVIKEYLRYPVNTHQQISTLFGINYCLLPNILPEWINERFLKPFLANRC